MSESAGASQETPRTDEELQKQVWPTILELQRVLVERLKGTTLRPGGGELSAISVTSCEHHSCA